MVTGAKQAVVIRPQRIGVAGWGDPDLRCLRLQGPLQVLGATADSAAVRLKAPPETVVNSAIAAVVTGPAGTLRPRHAGGRKDDLRRSVPADSTPMELAEARAILGKPIAAVDRAADLLCPPEFPALRAIANETGLAVGMPTARSGSITAEVIGGFGLVTLGASEVRR